MAVANAPTPSFKAFIGVMNLYTEPKNHIRLNCHAILCNMVLQNNPVKGTVVLITQQ
jgi:hypothetical protein